MRGLGMGLGLERPLVGVVPGPPPDIIAPVLTMPSGAPLTTTSIGGLVMTNEANGTLYYFVSQSATPPSIADLKAGTGADAAGNQPVLLAGMLPVLAAGLVEDNTYYIHYLHADAAGNDSNIATTTGILLTLNIPVPILTLLSGPGEVLSFSIDGLVPEQAAGNFDWEVEVAGDSGFTTGPATEPDVRNTRRQIQLSDFIDSDSDGNIEVEPFAATTSLPNGSVWTRIRLRSDDGNIGDWSNVLPHTIALQADITWSTSDKYVHALLDSGNLRMLNNDANVGQIRGGRANAGRNSNRYYLEWDVSSLAAGSPPSGAGTIEPIGVGFTDGLVAMTGFVTPGLSHPGCYYRCGDNIVYANGGVAYDGANDYNGPVNVGLIIDHDLQRCWFYVNGTILDGDPTTDSGGFTYNIPGNVFIWAAPLVRNYSTHGIDYILLKADEASQTYPIPAGGGAAYNGATQD